MFDRSKAADLVSARRSTVLTVTIKLNVSKSSLFVILEALEAFFNFLKIISLRRS